jgi:hypothetical protein
VTAAELHPRWPVWRIVLVYVIFAAVASGSVVVIDRDVMRAARQAAGDAADASQVRSPLPR